jgi:hypothetical protein
MRIDVELLAAMTEDHALELGQLELEYPSGRRHL